MKALSMLLLPLTVASACPNGDDHVQPIIVIDKKRNVLE
jgi:hypothetical protein